ncbi:YigZ family protein [bacterium]|nr:YigZ family protein [bacterium]
MSKTSSEGHQVTWPGEYLTVKGRSNQEIKVKGSRFIASVTPVGSEEEAKKFIGRVSGEYFDATHNCYAYRVGLGDAAISRYSDAGEPSGTAGRPILEAITGRDLTDVAVVVTRYFGGTKLGTGGLARAYKECAMAVLDGVGTARKFLTVDFMLSFAYPLTKEVQRILNKYHGHVLEEQYGQRVNMTVRVRKSRSESFREDVGFLGHGQVDVD